ncbi:HEAT repeat domain-containing protein [Candidatus Solincola tengchongensis]|uniref:HEAT repeat domain-containing protein n=1 Tax=Candidatus Solincola tengchongensis TaxID=2900693 RepID=UPI00257CB297|nr:HEAT repeat domain-containing protein [Candidatus Solincola tengchongensis]
MGEKMARFGFGKRDVRRLERERDVEGLVELLRDEDEKVAFQAIEALTRLGDKRGVEALMALVVDPTTTELIRAKAWLALDVGLAREAKKRTQWK